MKWDIQCVGFDARANLIEDTKEAVRKLERFFSPIIGAEVYFKLENDQQKLNKRVTLKLNIPGEDLSAEERAEHFEVALSDCIEKLRRQLQKKKELERTYR